MIYMTLSSFKGIRIYEKTETGAVTLLENARTFAVIDSVKEMTAKKSSQVWLMWIV